MTTPVWRRLRGVWPLALVGGWLVWVISHVLPRPLEADEIIFAYWAKHPLLSLPHPPFYMHLLALFHQGLGVSPEMLRMIGLGLLGLTAWVVSRVAERLAVGAGWWAAGLLLTSPLAIQGSMMLDIDNTLLLWWLPMSLWWVVRATWPLPRATLIGFGGWWALGLWMKLTTPLVWPVGLLAVYGWRREWRRGLRDVAFMSVVGAVIFLAAWTAYSRFAGLPWTQVFMGRVMEMFLRGPTDVGSWLAVELAERAVRIGLWIGPAMLGVWMFGSGVAYQDRRALPWQPGWVFLMVVGWLLLVGYWVVGGVVWSFAKYQVPLIPFMAIAGAVTLMRLMRAARVPRTLPVILIVAMALWQTAVVGDVLYLVNHTLRHAIMSASANTAKIMQLFVMRGGLLLAGPLIMGAMLWAARSRYHLTRRGLLAFVLTVSAMGHGIGLLTLQAPAAHSTVYCYGRPWSTDRAILDALRELLAAAPHARVLVSDRPYLQVTGMVCEPRATPCHYWTGHETADQLAALLQTTDYLVVDPHTNSVHLVRDVLPDPRVQAILSRDFEATAVETATAWTRRSLRRDGQGRL